MRLGVAVSAAAAAAAIVLAACGSNSSQSSSAAPTTSESVPSTTTSPVGTGKFNSCSVVTQSEAAAALGKPVTPGVIGTATVEGGLACVFYGPSAPKPTNPNVAQPDSVRVVVVKGSDALTWYKDYKSRVHSEPISGYGDEAYYDGYASLSVRKGNVYVRIAVVPAGAPPSLPAEKKLAAAILPSL